MDALFLKLLNMSITASWLVLVALGIRLLFRKAPKWIMCLLWGMVALRLICPFSFESSMSLIPNAEPVKQNVVYFAPMNEQTGDGNIEKDPVTGGETARPGIDPIPENNTDAEQKQATAPAQNWMQYLGAIWLAGAAGMLIYAVISYLLLWRRVATAIPVNQGIKKSEFVESPFVLGVIRPVIYLPAGMEETDLAYVIAHERAHIRRKDHWWKPLGFVLLSVYWFNPLLWAAYILLCRDIEAACDEKVIKTMKKEERRAYSAALLNCSIRRRSIAACPLAFGEVGVKERIKRVMDYKRPAFWVIILCILLCGVIAVCLLTNPKTEEPVTALEDEWGVAVAQEHFVSGSAGSFRYESNIYDPAGVKFVFEDTFSLDRLENGQWVRVEKPAEYNYYHISTKFLSIDEYSKTYYWEARFGGLPDGHYRLGNLVTRKFDDGRQEQKPVYWEFNLSEAKRMPLEELPQVDKPGQLGVLDACFIQVNGAAYFAKDLFYSFATLVQNDVPAIIRIIDWYSLEEPHYYKAYDLSYDGSVYTVSWLEDGQRKSEQFLYLKHFTGELKREDKPYGSYERYVLLNDDTVTWDDIMAQLVSSQFPLEGDNIYYMTVFYDYQEYPDYIALPDDVVKLELRFEGQTLVTSTERRNLKQFKEMFGAAYYLGYEPKTHSIGIGLDLVVTSAKGETMVIELDPDTDLCRIDGEYVTYDYSAFNETNYVTTLWNCLGIGAWPDEVYEKYPNTFR